MPPSPFDPADHRWGIAEGADAGEPLLIRFNSTARAWLADPGLGIRVGFAVPLREPDPGGLPTAAENEQLQGVEDIIRAEVAAGAHGLQVLALTTGLMKEFVFYVAEGADIGAIHQAIRRRVPTHDVQCMAVRDPDWDAYRQFSPAEPGDDDPA